MTAKIYVHALRHGHCDWSEWTGEVVYDDTTGSQTMDNSQTSFWRKVKKLITQKSKLVTNSLEI